jgi:hypothetical protein
MRIPEDRLAFRVGYWLGGRVPMRLARRYARWKGWA